jgi:hypothetical protein
LGDNAICDQGFCDRFGEIVCSGGGGGGGGASINVIEATYGANCGAARGNVTGHIAGQCNGRASCDYRVDHTVIGDPVYGCAKDYRVTYSCGPSNKEGFAGPEAGFGSIVQLRCP